jgi:acetate kinase
MKAEGGQPLTQESAPRWLFDWLRSTGYGREIVAAGHRVVHGGERFVEPVRIDDTVLDALERLDPMAPLHQPHNLAAVRALRALRPELPQVACFDTAFHRTQAKVAQHFALPRELTVLKAAWSWRTSATARACARCAGGAVLRRPWASPRSKA